MAVPKSIALIPGVDNRRVGRVRGDDGVERIVRTFHARFSGLKIGGGMTARTRIAYILREGQFADEKGDVEAAAGDKDTVIEHADRIRETARVRRGPTAERILGTQIVELPAESTPEQRAACARAFVNDWRTRGHEAVAVVHVHGEENPQPHLHVEVAARPVAADGAVDRARSLWRVKPDIYAERATVARLVNETCRPDPPYHPGGFRDIGREDDVPKTRVPPRPFREARAEIRAARAAGDEGRAAAAEAAMHAASARRREEIRRGRESRRRIIGVLKETGQWKDGRRVGRRGQVEAALDRQMNEANRWWREEAAQRGRAEQAEARVTELEASQVRPIALSEKQRPMLADVCARHGIEGSLDAAGVQLRAFAALHDEREERRRRRRKERDHDGRGTGEAGQNGRGAGDAGGGAADGDRRGDEGGCGAAQERARGDAGSDGPRRTDRAVAGGTGGPVAAPAAPVAPEVVAESPGAEMVAREAGVVGRESDGDGSGDRRPAGARPRELDDAVHDPEHGRPDLAGPPPDVVVAASKEGGEGSAIARLRTLAKPAKTEPEPPPRRRRRPRGQEDEGR